MCIEEFFLFIYKKTMILLRFNAEKNWNTSENTSELIMDGVSSIHVTKSSTNCACFASQCVALFPSLRMWQTSAW